MTKFTYDRRGNVIEIQEPDKNATEEIKNTWDALVDFRGVYNSREEAANAYQLSQPQFVASGFDPKTGKSTGFWQ